MLKINHISKAAELAVNQVKEARDGKFGGLKSRWQSLNEMLPMKRFLFGKGYVIGGMSGVSKSFFLNMLYQDFFNPDINNNYDKPIIGLHFALEMPASDEILRNLTYRTQLPLDTLLSVNESISASNFNSVIEQVNEIKDIPLYYCETSGNLEQIEVTIDQFAQEEGNGKNIIISLDHSLLVDYLTERDEIALVSAVSKLFLKKRKQINCMTFMVSQLNADIEDKERRSEDPRLLHLHYPIRKDLHGSKAVYRDADVVLILHAPAKLGINKYGKSKFSSVINKEPVIFVHQIKARSGVEGLVAFENCLNLGFLKEIPLNSLLNTNFTL